MFAGQFVPVKIVTKGEQWGDWKKKYPPIGSGIPYLYVIRADGTSLYAKSGAPQGDDLPKMLFTTLEQSGRILSANELEMIQAAVGEAEKHIANEQPLMAAKSISRIKKIGYLGELGSFAKSSIRADEIVKELTDAALGRLQKATEQISSTSVAFEDILEIVSIKTAHADFPSLKKEIRSASKGIQANASAKSQVKPAELLFRARQSAISQKRSDIRRAERSYASVIEKFADSPAAQIAREELRRLNPDSQALKPAASESASDETRPADKADGDDEQRAVLRTWKSKDGKFSVVAKLVERTDGSVKLERENGKQLDVPLERLSEQDHKFLRKIKQ